MNQSRYQKQKTKSGLEQSLPNKSAKSYGSLIRLPCTNP
jgi:hypothetical protein